MYSQEAAIQWMQTSAERCPGCGTLPEDEEAYRAEETICLVCQQRDNLRKHIQETRKSMAGIHVDVVRREDD